MQRAASSVNIRLVQEMANRPSVLAALRIKKRSLQQRLGRSGKIMNSQSSRARPGSMRGRGGNRLGGFKSGTSPLIKDRLGLPISDFKKNQMPNQRGGFCKTGNFRGRRQSRGGNRQQAQRNNLRGAGGRGHGKSWWVNRKGRNVPSKQELDNQLAEYMAGTKTHLDAQLEQYMSQG